MNKLQTDRHLHHFVSGSSFNDLMAWIKTNDPDETATDSAFLHTCSEAFLLQIESQLHLIGMQGRIPILREGHALHALQFFHGSTLILISQIEGILTSFMLSAGLAKAKGSKIIGYNKAGDATRLAGIAAKVESFKWSLGALIASDDVHNALPNEMVNRDYLLPLMDDILDYEIVPQKPETKINRMRNSILHGSDIAYGTMRNSFYFITLLAKITNLLSLK